MSRRRAAGSRSRTDRPPSRMSPSVMSIMRLTIRMAVVLPHPEGPTRTQMSPARTSRGSAGVADGPSDWAVSGAVTEESLGGGGGELIDQYPDRPLDEPPHA